MMHKHTGIKHDRQAAWLMSSVQESVTLVEPAFCRLQLEQLQYVCNFHHMKNLLHAHQHGHTVQLA